MRLEFPTIRYAKIYLKSCLYLSFSSLRSHHITNFSIILQYLPHLTAVHLCAHQSLDPDEKRAYKFLDAFFLAIYNTEAIDTQQAQQQQQSRWDIKMTCNIRPSHCGITMRMYKIQTFKTERMELFCRIHWNDCLLLISARVWPHVFRGCHKARSFTRATDLTPRASKGLIDEPVEEEQP